MSLRMLHKESFVGKKRGTYKYSAENSEKDLKYKLQSNSNKLVRARSSGAKTPLHQRKLQEKVMDYTTKEAYLSATTQYKNMIFSFSGIGSTDKSRDFKRVSEMQEAISKIAEEVRENQNLSTGITVSSALGIHGKSMATIEAMRAALDKLISLSPGGSLSPAMYALQREIATYTKQMQTEYKTFTKALYSEAYSAINPDTGEMLKNNYIKLDAIISNDQLDVMRILEKGILNKMEALESIFISATTGNGNKVDKDNNPTEEGKILGDSIKSTLYSILNATNLDSQQRGIGETFPLVKNINIASFLVDSNDVLQKIQDIAPESIISKGGEIQIFNNCSTLNDIIYRIGELANITDDIGKPVVNIREVLHAIVNTVKHTIDSSRTSFLERSSNVHFTRRRAFAVGENVEEKLDTEVPEEGTRKYEKYLKSQQQSALRENRESFTFLGTKGDLVNIHAIPEGRSLSRKGIEKVSIRAIKNDEDRDMVTYHQMRDNYLDDIVHSIDVFTRLVDSEGNTALLAGIMKSADKVSSSPNDAELDIQAVANTPDTANAYIAKVLKEGNDLFNAGKTIGDVVEYFSNKNGADATFLPVMFAHEISDVVPKENMLTLIAILESLNKRKERGDEVQLPEGFDVLDSVYNQYRNEEELAIENTTDGATFVTATEGLSDDVLQKRFSKELQKRLERLFSSERA